MPVPGAAVLFPAELTFMAATGLLRCRSEFATEPVMMIGGFLLGGPDMHFPTAPRPVRPEYVEHIPLISRGLRRHRHSPRHESGFQHRGSDARDGTESPGEERKVSVGAA